jgi:hypothetical protein
MFDCQTNLVIVLKGFYGNRLTPSDPHQAPIRIGKYWKTFSLTVRALFDNIGQIYS